MPEGHRNVRSLAAGIASNNWCAKCQITRGTSRAHIAFTDVSATVTRVLAACGGVQALTAEARYQQEDEHPRRRAQHGEAE